MKIEWEQRVRVSEGAPLSLVAACCQVAEGVTLPLAAGLVLSLPFSPQRDRRAQLSHGELPGGPDRARL